MAKRQTRPLTPAEAVRQGRKLIAERRRQEAARMTVNPPPAAGVGGARSDAGKPVPEQVQRVEVVTTCSETPSNSFVPEPTLIFAATIVGPEINTHPVGTWPIADLRAGQCRFACTGFAARPDQHRFCGAPVAWLRGKPTSWCSGHLPTVCGAPGFTAGGRSLADVQRGVQG